MACLIGTGEVGAALLAQKIDGVFFTGSVRHGPQDRAGRGPAQIHQAAAGAGRQGPDLCVPTTPTPAAAESLADGAMYNTGQSCCSWSASTCTRRFTTPL
jgi:acyl-CoA reductase-like NAD-dependent aldehyde dehydrogenase